jgi:putative tryptophan/tyrosine transport system substrate-binding protein
VARAQQQAMPVVGYLSGGSPGFSAPYVAAFRRGLGETEGRNSTIEYRWANGQYDRLSALASDLVNRKIDVIVASGGDVASRAAKEATSSIPIVFSVAADPIAAGLVASLARPGGNLTGVSFLAVELSPKRLELLSELVPQARVVALLVNPKNPTSERVMRDVLQAAHGKGIMLHMLKATTEHEIDTAFDTLARWQAQALVVDPDHFIDSRREQLVALTARHSIPAIYGLRELTAAGGLMSYGVILTGVYR